VISNFKLCSIFAWLCFILFSRRLPSCFELNCCGARLLCIQVRGSREMLKNLDLNLTINKTKQFTPDFKTFSGKNS